jgi:dihydroflavonol-4-reductase
MKVAITGAPGHVGSTLIREMLKRGGYEIRAGYYDEQKGIEPLDNIEKQYLNILDPESVSKFVKDADAVIHLAAVISIEGDPKGIVRATNYQGTKNVIEACEKASVKRLLHYSTIHAMNPYPLDEKLDETRDLAGAGKWTGSLYDQSKADGEREILAAVDRGLDAILITPTSIMGPWDFGPSLLGQAILDIYHRDIPTVVKGGYDWVDVRDIVQGTLLALEKGKKGEKYLFSGEFLTVGEVARMIGEITGRKVPTYETPTWLARVGVPFAKIESMVSGKPARVTNEALNALVHSNPLISSEKAIKELGYQQTPIRKTLEDTIAWFGEQGYLKN